jgi:hypothetical protein
MVTVPPKVSKAKDPFGYRLRCVYEATMMIPAERVFGPTEVRSSLSRLGNLMDEPLSDHELLVWLNALCSATYQVLVLVSLPTLDRNTEAFSDWQYKRA